MTTLKQFFAGIALFVGQLAGLTGGFVAHYDPGGAARYAWTMAFMFGLLASWLILIRAIDQQR
jgi:hypothetical protein